MAELLAHLPQGVQSSGAEQNWPGPERIRNAIWAPNSSQHHSQNYYSLRKISCGKSLPGPYLSFAPPLLLHPRDWAECPHPGRNEEWITDLLDHSRLSTVASRVAPAGECRDRVKCFAHGDAFSGSLFRKGKGGPPRSTVLCFYFQLYETILARCVGRVESSCP